MDAYKLIIDSNRKTDNISFYLADVLGHDFIHDMNTTSSMGLQRWNKVKDAVFQLLSNLQQHPIHLNLDAKFADVDDVEIFKKGGSITDVMNLIASPLSKNRPLNDTLISSALKEIIETPLEDVNNILPVFLNAYRNLAFDAFIKNPGINSIFNSHIHMSINNIMLDGDIKTVLKQFFIFIVYKSEFIREFNVDFDIIQQTISYNRDVPDELDIFVYETMFYLFGLIDNPYDYNTNDVNTCINDLNTVFEKYIQINVSKQHQQKGGSFCPTVYSNIHKIMTESGVSIEDKVSKMNELFYGELTERDLSHVRFILERQRQTKRSDLTFEDIVEQFCPSKLTRSSYAVILDSETRFYTRDINHINHIIASQAYKMINSRNARREPYKTLYTGLQNIETTNLDASLLQTMLSISGYQRIQHQELKEKIRENRDKLCIINNASFLSEDEKEMTFCPITSIIDGMPQCPYNDEKYVLQLGNMDVTITNEENTCYYTYKLTQEATNGCTLQIEWVAPNNLYRDNVSYTFNPRLKSSLSASVVLNNVLQYLIDLSLTNASTNANANFWDDIIADPTKSLSLLRHGIIKSCGDIGQELTSLCKYGGFTSINGSNPIQYDENGNAFIVYLANDRPSGCRYVFIRNTLISDPRLLSMSSLNLSTIGGYWSRNVGLISSRYIEEPLTYKRIKGGASKKKKKTLKKKTLKKKRYYK